MNESSFGCALKQLPDIEVIFEFNGVRRNPIFSGYRADHLVTETQMTTGVHRFYGTNSVPPDGTAIGTIAFLDPENLPNCFWIGKIINIQEGPRIVGRATITQIYNQTLAR